MHGSGKWNIRSYLEDWKTDSAHPESFSPVPEAISSYEDETSVLCCHCHWTHKKPAGYNPWRSRWRMFCSVHAGADWFRWSFQSFRKQRFLRGLQHPYSDRRFPSKEAVPPFPQSRYAGPNHENCRGERDARKKSSQNQNQWNVSIYPTVSADLLPSFSLFDKNPTFLLLIQYFSYCWNANSPL